MGITPVVTQIRGAHDHHAVEDPVKVAIGNREIVGFGMNGQPNYLDRVDFPMPAIRYKEMTPDIQVLKNKETGDWSKLTIEEKKALYRASFCQTFTEMSTLRRVEIYLWIESCWNISSLLDLLLDEDIRLWPSPSTFTKEKQEAQLKRMIDMQMNPIEGLASKWDYEKGQWK